MMRPVMEAEATDAVARLADNLVAMRTRLEQRQALMRAVHADGSKKPGITREEFAEKMKEFDASDEIALGEMMADGRRLVVGVVGAFFRAVEALEDIAENTGPGTGK
jgi:hypothetical protein